MSLLSKIKEFLFSNKKSTHIITEDLIKIYKATDMLEVGLSSNNEPLANKTISIEINGKSYDRETDENGIARLNINLGVGKYKPVFTFKGDDEYKSSKGHAQVYVNPIIESSDLEMSEKDGSKFTVTAKDNDGNPIPNIKITFEINGVIYQRGTNEQGQSSLNINLPKGQYKIKTILNNIKKENQIDIQEPVIITQPSSDKHFGYWVFGRDMLNTDLNALKNNNVTDIFLNYYAFEAHGNDRVLQWIRDAKNLGINTHIWMQCFYNGEWQNPKTTNLIDKIEEARTYANMADVYGVHLDYLRYPGNAYKTDGGVEAINDFVKNVRSAVGKKFLSCAIMPESENVKYYGQDAEALGQVVDAILPMQYKGNYEAGTSWLASTTQNFSSKAVIWSGLQSYKSDDDTTVLSNEELLNDINTCISNGAKGAILFRYGLSPNINFPAVAQTTDKKATRMEGTDINMTYKDGTQYQCAVYDDVGRVAGNVNIEINGRTYPRNADGEGLYKLNINLTPGNYTITSSYSGDATHLPSSVQNTLTINEPKEEPKSEPVQLYDYFTNEGGGYLGQKTPYSCACHSLVQCFYRLTGEDVSEETLMSICGTTTDGTDHDGINTGVDWFNRTYGYDIKIEWMNFSDLGNNADERFAKIQDMINNGAMFFHLLYRDQWGHYEVIKEAWDDPLIILNSLGDYCNYPAYCGYLEYRDRASQLSYISGISQPSVAFLHR